MIEADRDKLLKFLRLFSSNHDGEVMAAARAAHKLITARQLDWDDLIIAVKRRRAAAEAAPAVDEDEADLIRRCDKARQYLSEWEAKFVLSVGQSIMQWGRLTPKQRQVIDRIVNKLKLQGVWL